MTRSDKGSQRAAYVIVPCTGCGVLVRRRASEVQDRVFHSRLCFQSYMDNALVLLDRYQETFGPLSSLAEINLEELITPPTEFNNRLSIYVVMLEHDEESYLVRVGLTFDLLATLRVLAAAQKGVVKPLAIHPADIQQEKLLHQVLANWHVRGEVYRFPKKELVDLVHTVLDLGVGR